MSYIIIIKSDMVHMTTLPCINYPPLSKAFAMLSRMVFMETSFSDSGISSSYVHLIWKIWGPSRFWNELEKSPEFRESILVLYPFG
jgi:hypothetical protein